MACPAMAKPSRGGTEEGNGGSPGCTAQTLLACTQGSVVLLNTYWTICCMTLVNFQISEMAGFGTSIQLCDCFYEEQSSSLFHPMSLTPQSLDLINTNTKPSPHCSYTLATQRREAEKSPEMLTLTWDSTRRSRNWQQFRFFFPFKHFSLFQ